MNIFFQSKVNSHIKLLPNICGGAGSFWLFKKKRDCLNLERVQNKKRWLKKRGKQKMIEKKEEVTDLSMLNK